MRARTAAIAAGVAGLAFIAWAPHAALGPGPQSQGHVRIENRCLDCHTLGRGVSDAKCTRCHPADRIGADDGAAALRALHARLGEERCTSCHTDHAGREPSRATRAFRHEMLGPALQGDCGACHDAARPRDELHRDVGTDCGSCHRTTAWKPAQFAHERWFVLDRDHAVACRTCHDAPPGYASYTCYGCHEHTPAGMRDEHREVSMRGGALDACARCHRSADDDAGEHGRGRGRGRGGDDD